MRHRVKLWDKFKEGETPYIPSDWILARIVWKTLRFLGRDELTKLPFIGMLSLFEWL